MLTTCVWTKENLSALLCVDRHTLSEIEEHRQPSTVLPSTKLLSVVESCATQEN